MACPTGKRPNLAEAMSKGGTEEVEDKYCGLMCCGKESQFSEAETLRSAGGGRVELCKGAGRGGLSVKTQVSFHFVLPLTYADVSSTPE